MKTIMFFAVRNHHAKYFHLLSNTLSGAGWKSSVVRHKSLWRIPTFDLCSNSRAAVKQAVEMKLNEAKQNTVNYKLGVVSQILFPILYTIAGLFLMANYGRHLRRSQPDSVVVWSGVMWHQQLLSECAKSLGIRVLYMENGPLPNTTAIDKNGVNYVNSMPRERAYFDVYSTTHTQLPSQLVSRETHHKKTASKLPTTSKKQLPKKYIFVPFQVDSDKQILCYSPWIKNMEELHHLLTLVTGSLPNEWVFVIKEHPSCKKDFSGLHNANRRILFCNDANTQTLIVNSKAVLNINSSVGIEALLLGKPVITIGEAFYNVPGLVSIAKSIEELQRVLEADSLNFDKKLVNKYLLYLYHVYLVKGSWKEPDQQHIRDMCNRIQELANG